MNLHETPAWRAIAAMLSSCPRDAAELIDALAGRLQQTLGDADETAQEAPETARQAA